MSDKEYYQKNKKRILAYQREYRKKNKEKIFAYHKKDYKLHKEERKRENRKYYQTHKEERKKYAKLYSRKHKLQSGSKKWHYGLNKRDWTGYCELCGRENTHLAYHHWDDKDLNKGIWVCFTPCHQICEQVDKNQLYLIGRYKEFKKLLDKQYQKKGEIKCT